MINAKKARAGIEVLDLLVALCGTLNVGNTSWEAVLFEEEELIPGQRPTGIGLYTRKAKVRIQRKKDVLPENASRLRRSLRAMRDAFEPAIIIGPFHEDSLIHCLNMELAFGVHTFSSPYDAKWMYLCSDIKAVWAVIQENFPETKYHHC